MVRWLLFINLFISTLFAADVTVTLSIENFTDDGEGNVTFDVMLENGATISGGDPLPGFAGGFVLKGGLASIAPLENDCADLYIEWHAVDGPISGSGLGDILGQDEDGDGTDFDNTWSLEKLTLTKS